MKGRVEEQVPLAFAFIIAKLEILHQNHEFLRNQVPNTVHAY